VVKIDIQIAAGLNGQVEKPMHRQQCQHVVEKRYPRSDLMPAGPIQLQFDPNLSFFCCAFYVSLSFHGGHLILSGSYLGLIQVTLAQEALKHTKQLKIKHLLTISNRIASQAH
jgi:hypothetical protein